MRTLALIVLIANGPFALAHPVDDVLKKVPSKTALCLVAKDLHQTVGRLSQSPFAAWLKSSPLHGVLGAPGDPASLADFERMLTQNFGLTADELLRDVFGDAVAFCFEPGPPERSLILVKPRKPDVAAGFLAKLDELQKNELKSVTTETVAGATITIREKANGQEAYTWHEGLLLFSGDRRTIVDYLTNRPVASKPRIAESLSALKTQDSPLTLWIDPRAFDDEFRKDRPADPREGLLHDLVAGVWMSVEHLAFHIDFTDVLTIRASMRFIESKLPEASRNWLPQAGRSSLWEVIPADALLAIAGRIKLSDALKPFEGDTAKSLAPLVGKNKYPALLEAVGPDWGFWMTEPERTGHWLPDWTFTVKVRPDVSGKTDSAQVMADTADAAAQLFRMAYNTSNADQIELTETILAGHRIRVIRGDGLPSGLTPSFSIKAGFFLLASNPERIARFESPRQDDTTSRESPLLRISSSGLKRYLDRHGDALALSWSKINGEPATRIKRSFLDIGAFLAAIDRAELSASHHDGVSRLSLTFAPVKPLQK